MEKRYGLLVEALALVVVSSITLVIAPLIFLYTFGGVSQQANLTTFLLYEGIGFGMLLVILTILGLRYTGFFERYPEFEGFKHLTVHTPEDSWMGQKFKIVRNPVALASMFTVVGLIFGLGASLSGEFASGTPALVQGSFNPSSNAVQVLGLAVEPAVTAETFLINVVMLYATAGIVYYFLYMQNAVKRLAMPISLTVGVIVSTILGYGYHVFRYGVDTTNQLGVFGLMFLTNATTALFNSAIAGYILHFWNNFFVAASSNGIFTSDTAIIVAFIGVVLSTVVLYLSGIRPVINSAKSGGGGFLG